MEREGEIHTEREREREREREKEREREICTAMMRESESDAWLSKKRENVSTQKSERDVLVNFLKEQLPK